MTAAIAHSVSKQLGHTKAVQNVSLEIGKGRAFGLLGPNGAGKTTMVRLLTGILSPDSGSIEVLGTRLGPESDRIRERIGVQTDTNVYELLTAEQNLQVWGRLYGVPEHRIQQRIDELLEQFELLDKRKEKAGALSRGMRQKLAVARALLHEPELLFLDEPTAGLDPAASDELIRHLKSLILNSETTVVICTHQLRGLETLVDDLAFIREGSIVDSGSVRELLRKRWPGVRYHLAFKGDPLRVRELSARFPHKVDHGSAQITFPDKEAAADFLKHLSATELRVYSFTHHEPSIHELYIDTVLEKA